MSTITYIVKVASSKFEIDGASAPKLTFRDGDTYVFDQADASNSGHILQFSATSNNSGSSEYTTGVTKTGTPGNAGAKTTIVTSGSTTDTLYYYSSGGGTYGEEFSNTGFNTSTNFNFLKPIVGAESTAEKWGPMVNHMVDQIDQNISGQDLDGATDSGTVAVDLDSQSLTVAGGSGIATSGSGQTITVSVPNDGIDSQHYAADSIDAEHYAAGSVDATAIANDAVDSQHYVAGSIDGEHIANDAVDSQHIAADSIDAEHYAAGSVDATAIANDIVDSQHYAPASVDTTAMAASVIGVKPHIIPGVLYPAVVGKLSDGSTSHGSTYGVAQSDGRSYYYTDIKGSKPIKDPRIGAHFGSQRHKFKSIQLLEQETATHGKQVYSVDGRENIRIWCTGDFVTMVNDSSGLYINSAYSGQSSVEVVGYFSGINILGRSLVTSLVNQGQLYYIDGVALNSGAEQTDFETTVSSPLGSRFVDNANLLNVTSTQTLGIHTFTLKEFTTTETTTFFGVELIAQDTSNRSNIQIPSQNVVSYGKKFTVSGTPHYDPFNGFTSGSSVTAYLDTATSLGVEGWKNSSTYYRPYNGGRVVRWVDSSGVIKTSVNMMPPNARSIGNSSSLTNATAKANASIANNTFYPTMEAGTIDHSQAEVAKTFHHREFGNGAANGGTGSGTYADASMLNTVDDIAYVMDDGLTSLSANDTYNNGDSIRFNNATSGEGWYLTFIGTGFSFNGNPNMRRDANHQTNLVQNLPYGTHIVEVLRTTAQAGTLKVDGVLLHSTVDNVDDELTGLRELTIHQPKMPPIPEDAVVISDYMLMADFVKETGTGASIVKNISKGVRMAHPTRDIFVTTGSANHLSSNVAIDLSNGTLGMKGFGSSANGTGTTYRGQGSLPFFGNQVVIRATRTDTATHTYHIDGGSSLAKTALDSSDDQHGDKATLDADLTLGVHTIKADLQEGGFALYGFDIASPIHTSSHYQTFETPFLHELVGGDRNMEQTNLVVTPDGQTWDEVTRNTSYMGPSTGVVMARDGGNVTSASWIWDFTRGAATNGNNMMQKNIAIAYDRLIFLEAGEYEISWILYNIAVDANIYVMKNSTTASPTANLYNTRLDSPDTDSHFAIRHRFLRGDFLYFEAGAGNFSGLNSAYNNLSIKKLN